MSFSSVVKDAFAKFSAASSVGSTLAMVHMGYKIPHIIAAAINSKSYFVNGGSDSMFGIAMGVNGFIGLGIVGVNVAIEASKSAVIGFTAGAVTAGSLYAYDSLIGEDSNAIKEAE